MMATITVNLAPTFSLGPLTLAWHGVTIALGMLVAWLWAERKATSRGLAVEPLTTIALLAMLGALVGSRVFWLVEHGISDPSRWLGTNGFTFDGGLIASTLMIAVYLWRSSVPLGYLDLAAEVFPIGVAIGRIGDVINGEHYGAPSNWLLSVRNANPASLTPRSDIAYHSGGLYEVLLALALAGIAALLARRLRPYPLALVWLLLGALSIGRFAEFFLRADSPATAVGLSSAQWTSVALLGAAVAGAWLTSRHLWTVAANGSHAESRSSRPGPSSPAKRFDAPS